jgi:polyisoprenoid-binding protein YceI
MIGSGMSMQTQKTVADNTQTLWAVDPSHTTVEFTVRNFFLFTVRGSIDVREGSVVLDQADVRRSSMTVVLQSASINTGNKRRDAHLRTARYLDADRYPETSFQSTKVEPGGDRDTLRVTGSLTIKDQTREIVLDVIDVDRSCSPSGEQVAYYTAFAELDRHEFGIDYMRGLIGRTLKVTINVQATRRT